jgi:PAT family beta-lactamase induction signal transducer AmpG
LGSCFASASNDVASDGFINRFRKDQQSLGISTFYRLSMLTGNGLIVIIGGYLEQQYGDKQAWSYTMIIVGLLMAIITLYNYFTTPRTETSIAAT